MSGKPTTHAYVIADGPDKGRRGGVHPNVDTIHLGHRGQERTYQRTSDTDGDGRRIFVLGERQSALTTNLFPVGAKVYVDGEDLAIVAQVFPGGSSSFLFPHYKVHFVGGDRNVAVNMSRVGVVAKKGA